MRTRLLSPILVLLFAASILAVDDEQHDVREGDSVTLQCRFNVEPHAESVSFYWLRNTAAGHDNVAIGEIPFDTDYGVVYAPSEGRFDLMVSNISYSRDNGRFECRVKAGGSGRTLHSQGHLLTVLTPPDPPRISPGPRAQAQEGKDIKLECSTTGGSPEPEIKWYRDSSTYPLEAVVTHGKTRSEPSVSTFTLTPTPEDDGATFRCSVSNRAMPEGQKLEETVDLSVNYFPRVEIGPDNPLRVEMYRTATMECKVDAKPKVNTVRWTRNGKYISNSFTHTIQGVTVEEAGKYTCTADNGLGRPGEREIFLDVLYPPTVTVGSKTYEAEAGGTIEIKCDVSSNPEPILVEWTLEGNKDFQQKGHTLQLTRVNAEMAGTYVCRAVNLISTSDGNKAERSNSASVAVLVRHKPGRAHITPERPVAQEGTGVTLTCSAKPPGWPAPQYRWFRNINITDSKPAVLSTGNMYTIPSAHLGSEGVYHCQATNELGHGDYASVSLEVHQPPRFQSKLQTHVTKRSGEQDFSVTCSVLGKPRPTVKWFKDNLEIRPDTNLYEVKTDITEGRNDVSNVQSTLRFKGKARTNTIDLQPDDKGLYNCAFENEVKKVESTMHLRIEHEPIPIRLQTKVAYDLMEIAEISCRVQAYPKPEFQWFFGSSNIPLQGSSEGHYTIDTTTDNNDSYLTVLKIKYVKAQDYGEYTCKVRNLLGTIKPYIRLQPKGAPESPRSLSSQKMGPSYVVLQWESGFDGGLSSTKYFVRYRRIARGSGGAVGDHCNADSAAQYDDWLEYDCGRANPCNVTRLDQHNSYVFKVKAVNTKGQSNYSNEIEGTTKVDRIPPPEQVTFDPSSKTMAFSVGATCLALVGVAESLANGGWQVVDTLTLRLSGAGSTVQEHPLDLLSKARPGGRGPVDSSLEDLNPRFRLKLCLQHNHEVCSDYTEAEIGPSYIKEASSLTTMTVMAIMGSCLFIILLLSLIFYVFCRCKGYDNKMERCKDYETESMQPSAMNAQNQAPPPYYPSAGMENKALEHSMDLALSVDDSKGAVYATRGGYGYHIAPHAQGHPGQNPEWELGYIENSFTNSNNGGSVNSQDSLWQVKMAGAANTAIPPHQHMDRQSNYEYGRIPDPAYGSYDVYGQYAPMPRPGQPPADYNMRSSQNPSRQEYCSDPYASVHKPKKRIDQHIESPYHEVSGLPETYGNDMDEPGGEEKPPHLSLSYDETLESGYSTPNSRARRVIREIIV